MRALASLVAFAALTAARAEAAPTADIVVVWAPGQPVEPLAAAARAGGAAVIDRTPAASHEDLAAQVAQGIAAYDALHFDDAWTLLGRARDAADRTGAAGLATARLADLFVYRGLVRIQQGDTAAAWDELVTAMAVEPARVFDPARFPPQVIDQLERARAAIAAVARVALVVQAPPGCTTRIDGELASDVPRPLGPHWIAVACPEHLPWGTRVELAAAMTVAAHPVPLAPPDDGELLVQARVAGARALIVVATHGAIASVRLLAIDGRELVRRTVAVGEAAAAVRELLAPAPQKPWYASRWAWAAGAALLAAAILVPITAAIASEHAPTTGIVQPTNVPAW